MDDYTREMMDLKTLVTRTLEKKGVLAKIRAELRASVFEAIEEEDRVIEKDEGLPPALLGSCNDRAKQLHASPSDNAKRLFCKLRIMLVNHIYGEAKRPIVGRLLTALICEYLDWAQLNHTLKVYLPECNLPKDSWKAELKEFSNKNGYDLNRNGESGPVLLDVLEGFLKFESLSQARGTGRRLATENEPSSNLESRNMRRPSSSSAVAGGLPPLVRSVHPAYVIVTVFLICFMSSFALAPLMDSLIYIRCDRPLPGSQASERRAGSSTSSYRRYDGDELPDDVIRASAALENLQLDRKTRNLTSSWRHGGEGVGEDDGGVDHM
ncbi:hypothetical protein Cgig2_026134 [Carnegiea gigantea]|uniref:LisH domain-containing protein n=1 Tax=Carnegiea gigantea TaxID=171969 RepID=A0A9Q1JXK5_9CARY|nr:hypothetical protein Cgig2_026134 [Carnegiea gigantea]